MHLKRAITICPNQGHLDALNHIQTVAGLKKYLAQSRLAMVQEIQTIKKLQFDKAALTYDYYASAQHTTGLFLSKYLNKTLFIHNRTRMWNRNFHTTPSTKPKKRKH